MNILVKYGKINHYESVWRDTSKIKKSDYDHHEKPFPYPTQRKGKIKNARKFLNRLQSIQDELDARKQYRKYNKKKKDVITGKRGVTKKRYKVFNVHWEDSLVYYINAHRVKPTNEFVKFINRVHLDKWDKFQLGDTLKDKDIIIEFPSVVFKMDRKRYVQLTKNQLMIMDALMKDGGNDKTYFDNEGQMRYSEHSGLLDFNNTGLEKILINSKTGISDDEDYTILLPENMIETYDYEYLFHTHPPTPLPGSRAKTGTLYEFPSVDDIIHFVEHYNSGITQGSIVVAPEGIYVIKSHNVKRGEQILIHDDEEVFDEMREEFFLIQNRAIAKYGTKFSRNKFFSKIAQDKSYIGAFNNFLKNYHLKIYYKPRTKHNGRWILDEIYLPVSAVEPLE